MNERAADPGQQQEAQAFPLTPLVSALMRATGAGYTQTHTSTQDRSYTQTHKALSQASLGGASSRNVRGVCLFDVMGGFFPPFELWSYSLDKHLSFLNTVQTLILYKYCCNRYSFTVYNSNSGV